MRLMRGVYGKAKPQHTPGQMNKTEARYALVLEYRKQRGEIAEYAFEPVKFRLADRTYYTPDFLVVLADGTVELHELKAQWDNGKAGWQDTSRVKIKVAAEMHPFHFVAVTETRNGHEYERIGAGGSNGEE